jgi:putative cell wall-binding protein
MIRDFEDLKQERQQMMEKLDGYQNDYHGCKSMGADKMRQLEGMKEQLHKKTNIIHMLTMELREQGVKVENSSELKDDQQHKNTRLLTKTQDL